MRHGGVRSPVGVNCVRCGQQQGHGQRFAFRKMSMWVPLNLVKRFVDLPRCAALLLSEVEPTAQLSDIGIEFEKGSHFDCWNFPRKTQRCCHQQPEVLFIISWTNQVEEGTCELFNQRGWIYTITSDDQGNLFRHDPLWYSWWYVVVDSANWVEEEELSGWQVVIQT